MVVWQFWQAVLLAMCVGPLPAARAPLWQPTQLPGIPAWSGRAAPALEKAPAPSEVTACGVTARPALPEPASAAGAPTTVPIVARPVTLAGIAFFAAAPPSPIL